MTSVIFLAAINEYDMILEEDGETNRLVESLKLWKALTGSQFFKNTPFILFLNKSDLFSEKIKTIPLGKIFIDYPGLFILFFKSLLKAKLKNYLRQGCESDFSFSEIEH